MYVSILLIPSGALQIMFILGGKDDVNIDKSPNMILFES
jgi:hypothetical protein